MATNMNNVIKPFSNNIAAIARLLNNASSVVVRNVFGSSLHEQRLNKVGKATRDGKPALKLCYWDKEEFKLSGKGTQVWAYIIPDSKHNSFFIKDIENGQKVLFFCDEEGKCSEEDSILFA